MRKVLSKEELRKLMLVPTTIAQARQIILRNTVMLEGLKNRINLNTQVGCPHCSKDEDTNRFNCRTCAYQAYPINSNHQLIGPCCYAKFGGQSYLFGGRISFFIGLECDSEYIHADQKMSREDLCAVRRFLNGHIEWARAVIRHLKKKKVIK
jgi:hypothetical protein